MISAAVTALRFLMATAKRNDQSKRSNDSFPFPSPRSKIEVRHANDVPYW